MSELEQGVAAVAKTSPNPIPTPNPNPSPTPSPTPSRVFIIFAHGELPVVDDSPVFVESLVDTFTTAKIGHPLIIDGTIDPPDVHFIHNLFRLLAHHEKTGAGGVLTKHQLKVMVRSALCNLRGNSIVTGDKCKFRCHRKGKQIAEMILFGVGDPIPESIVRLDPNTGVIKDVARHFGLVEKPAKSIKEYPMSTKLDISIAGLVEQLKSSATRELSELQTEIAKTPKRNHTEFRKLDHLIQAKWQRIQALDAKIRGMNRESRFEFPSYVSYVKRKHGDVITLSGLIQNAIDTKDIDPDADVVVVFSCRGPKHPLSNLSGLRSPRDSNESASEGGRMCVRTKSQKSQKSQNQKKRKVKKTCKYTRKR
uniref:Uncharacterized protein n=1 Tax=viral metagenome TaxID=1070528 RepID=A0A6C0I731_9ZZZZ